MREGIDFAWGRCDTTALKRAGRDFICRYLSTPGNTKNLTKEEVDRYTKAKVDIVVVFETTAGRATAGYGAGQVDAKRAAASAKALGMPDDRPIYFAVDFPGAVSQVRSYFDGVKSVIGLDRTGVYGSYYIVRDLDREDRAEWLWQTYAWSQGNFYAGSNVFQYSNDHTLAGVSCDYNKGYGEDFGQWRKGFSPSEMPKHRYATRTVGPGDRGTDVQRLQGFMDHRLRNHKRKGLKRTGTFDKATVKARHDVMYDLGFPAGTIHANESVSVRSQKFIRHPEERPRSYKLRAKARALLNR